MRKIYLTAFCAFVLIISGCSDASTQVSEGSDSLITIDGTDITKGDIYKGLAAQGNITPITSAIDSAIVKKAIPTSDAMKTQADTSLASYKESVGADKWDNYLKTNGYKNEKDFYENQVLASLKIAELTQTYINDNFADLVKKYEVRKLAIVVTTDKEKAKEAIVAIKKDGNMESAATTYGDTTTYKGSEAVYTNQSGLPEAVWKRMLTLKDGESFPTAVKDGATNSYYIVKVVSSKAKKDFKDEAISTIKGLTATSDKGLTLDETAYNFYLEKAGFRIHDAEVYSALLTNSKKYSEK